MEGLELRKNIEIKFKHNGKEFTFKMRELSAGDIWGITSSCINPKTGVLDGDMNNRLCLSKSIVEPSLSVEEVGNLPPRVTAILFENYNKIHTYNPQLEALEEAEIQKKIQEQK